MKKFTKIFICLLLCVFGFALSACDNRSNKEKAFTYPNSSNTVVGNDGLAVQVGNYLYFVNGYKSITSDEVTQNASYSHANLLLVRLNNGELPVDDDGLLKESEYIVITDRLVGFQCSGLFVSGDYLYFATQCQENEGGANAKDRVWANEIVEFYRIKLDKTSNPERIYQSTDSYDDVEFKFYNTSAGACLLVYEKSSSKLVRVMGGNTVYENVTSVGFADNGENVFYVQRDGSNYVLYKWNMSTNQTYNFESRDKTFKVEFVSDEFVFISYSRSSNGTTLTNLYRANVNNGSFADVTYNVADYKMSVTFDGVVVAVKDNAIKLFDGSAVSAKAVITEEEKTKITVVGFVNGSIVYVAEKDSKYQIKMVSYANVLDGNEAEITLVAEVEKLSTTYFDLDENYLYFFTTVGEHEYLNRVNINNVDGEQTVEMVGTYLNEDIPTQDAEESAEEE